MSKLEDLLEKGKVHTFEISDTMPMAGTKYVGFTTGGRPVWLLLTQYYLTGTPMAFTLYEGGSFSGGTEVATEGRNRRFAHQSHMIPGSGFKGVTVSELGQAVAPSTVVDVRSSGGLSESVGTYGTDVPMVLKDSTNYILEVTNEGGTSSGDFRVVVLVGAE